MLNEMSRHSCDSASSLSRYPELAHLLSHRQLTTINKHQLQMPPMAKCLLNTDSHSSLVKDSVAPAPIFGCDHLLVLIQSELILS